MIIAPTASNDGSVGFGAPGSRALTPKTSLPIEAEATEEPCHSEEGVSPTWESVPLNVSIIWEFDIKQRFLGIRIATATGGLAMTVRNLIPYS